MLSSASTAVAAGREWTEYDTSALLRSLFKEQIDGLARCGAGGHPCAQRCAQCARPRQCQRMAMSRACSNRWCRSALSTEPPPAPAPPQPPAANDDDEPELDEADTRALIMSRIKRDMHERHSQIA